MIEGSGAGFGFVSGSVPWTNESGSGMPKNIRIRNTGYKNDICCVGENAELHEDWELSIWSTVPVKKYTILVKGWWALDSSVEFL